MNSTNLILPIFPEAVIYSTTININKNEILNFCKNSNFYQTESSINEECYCYMSYDRNIFDKIKNLKIEIEKHVEYYLHEILKYKMDYKFINSWITKTNPGGYSHPHTHANTFLSGVYYPLGNDSFKIKFIKKDMGFFSIATTENNLLTGSDVTLDIVNDSTLLFFPSSIKHSIEKNNSNIERYSIAFNINPKGFIGEGDVKVYF